MGVYRSMIGVYGVTALRKLWQRMGIVDNDELITHAQRRDKKRQSNRKMKVSGAGARTSLRILRERAERLIKGGK